MNYITQKEYRQAKSNLTRKVNKFGKTDPQKVVDHVNAVFASWDARDLAYPDDWHRWEMARYDAETRLRYMG